MTYLILQIVFCLLLAFLLGVLLGWWFGRRSRREALDRAERAWRRELEDCREALEECETERAARRQAPSRTGGEESESRMAALPQAAAAGSGLLGVAVPGESEERASPEPPPAADDLRKVEGIGPKIEGLLNAAGIETWRRLSETPVDAIQAVLDAAGPRYRIHDPATWPDQARLAAEGRWDELEQLQDLLRGGRDS